MRFYGVVGYGVEEESVGGVWTKRIHEVSYFGDVVKNTRRLQDGEKVNSDISVGNTISIMADAYANDNFFAIKFVEWAGVAWTVSEVIVERPRLLLRLGGVYNGPRSEPNSDPAP
jgi:hypothetical protein